MEILLWLAPAAVVTCVTMLWVAWWGRESRAGLRPIDREAAAQRLGDALERADRRRPGYAVPRREEDRSTGVALRAGRSRPVVIDGLEPDSQPREEPRSDGEGGRSGGAGAAPGSDRNRRRAS